MPATKKKLAISKTALIDIKTNSHLVFYGTSPGKISGQACFRTLWLSIAEKDTLYYLLPLANKEKLAHREIIMSIARMFKSAFTFKIKSIEPNLLLITISNIKNISPTMKETGYLLITTLIRALDSEHDEEWQELQIPEQIKNVRKLIENFYTTYRYGHEINSTFGRLRKTQAFLPFLTSYITNITTVFGTKKYKLNKPNQGLTFRNGWCSGRGFNYAYNVVERVISGELK